MRTDKYLKVARIIKRRTIANEACDAGRVLVNGKAVKAGYEIKAGDLIEISLGSKVSRYKVLQVKETIRKEEADALYEVIP